MNPLASSNVERMSTKFRFVEPIDTNLVVKQRSQLKLNLFEAEAANI